MELTKKEELILKKISKLIPGIKLDSTRASDNNSVIQSHYYLSRKNEDILNSEYFYKGKGDDLSFIHFTNLASLQGIITNKNIRLYNLNNLNDPREFSFAGNLISFDETDKNDAKSNFYLLSMCNKNIFYKSNTFQNEFNMWRLYGNDGQGVALELDFNLSDPQNWTDYYLNEVYYGSASTNNFMKIGDQLKKLKNQKPLLKVNLGQLACFHKSELYKRENEIRLLFDNRKSLGGATKYSSKGKHISPIIKTDITKFPTSKDPISFLELTIYHSNYTKVFENNPIPVPKIKKIILGYKLKENLTSLTLQLQVMCNEHLGYIPEIEMSCISKLYYDEM